MQVKTLVRDYGTEEAHGRVDGATTGQYLASRANFAIRRETPMAHVMPDIPRQSAHNPRTRFWGHAPTPSTGSMGAIATAVAAGVPMSSSSAAAAAATAGAGVAFDVPGMATALGPGGVPLSMGEAPGVLDGHHVHHRTHSGTWMTEDGLAHRDHAAHWHHSASSLGGNRHSDAHSDGMSLPSMDVLHVEDALPMMATLAPRLTRNLSKFLVTRS